jgi:Heparinase II/III-like protein/Heparinase II/III N-terminus
MRVSLYLHALRVARARQLRARAARGVRRRRFPPPRGVAAFRPLAVPLWRGPAFAAADAVARDGAVDLLGKTFGYPPSEWSLAGEPRLRRFHTHYGDEILGWARRGDVAAAGRGLRAWIGGNPPRAGDAWHPYTLSTRVGNWIAALSLAPELADTAVLESVRRQLEYLSRNVEDDVLGNHLIRNARALVLGGLALGDRRLLEQGVALLRRELPEQVLADGGHYERSPVYHLVVLRDLCELRDAGETWLQDTIARMERFASALARPDGRPALFNDGALDLAPRLDLPPAAQGLTALSQTGYAVLRTDRVWLAFDCGPPGPAFLPAHAHADALSVQIWIDGRPVVVDPGAYTYEPGPERDWFRSTLAHSTVAVGGRDQFELWGAFRAGPLPEVRLVDTEPLVAEVRTADAVHTRSISVRGAEIVVEDEVGGRVRGAIVSSIPLAPDRRDAVEPDPAADRIDADGWLAEQMLERTRIPIVRMSLERKLPVRTGWKLRIPSAS